MIPREVLREFYWKSFSTSLLFRVIDPDRFEHREFGFLYYKNDEKIFKRNTSFKSPEDLMVYVRREVPHAIMVGGLYDPPPRGTSITKLEWLGRELIFDLDLTDYDDIRTCGKGKDHVCKRCWPLVRDAALFIDETLREDFGFKKITWVFSGRRGLHAWISDKEALTLCEEARDAIVSWISPQGEKIRRPFYWQRRALRILGGMTEVKFSDMLTLEIKQVIFRIWREKVVKRIPRVDRKVTIDINRLLRMPGSVHPDTGRLVIIVNDLQNFYVDDAPTIYELIS